MMNMPIPNTFGLEVYANKVIECSTTQAILNEYQLTQQANQSFMVLGEGSNSLFTQNFNGTVALNRIKGIQITEDADFHYLTAGAGENWHQLVVYSLQHNIPGLENLALIPGCVGSAPIQNIGAYGVEFKQFAHYVKLLSLETGEEITVKEGQYGYRESIFKKEYRTGYVVIEVALKIPKVWTPNLSYGELAKLPNKELLTPQTIFDKVCEIRRSKLPNPNEIGNAGSFYKNPVISKEKANLLLIDYPMLPMYPQADKTVKIAAGWLIDQCGFKSIEVGGASVYDKQALILINKNHATSEDIVKLSQTIQQEVCKKFGITLEPEVRFIPE